VNRDSPFKGCFIKQNRSCGGSVTDGQKKSPEEGSEALASGAAAVRFTESQNLRGWKGPL